MHYIEYIDKLAALNYLCEIAESRGLKVNDLLDDFVDKGNFTKIKKGTTKKVSLDLVMFLANKLGENVEDVFTETSPTDPNFFEAIDSIKYYNKIKDFKASKYILEKTKKSFSSEIDNSIEISQIIAWNEGIINFNLNNDVYSTIEKLNIALSFNFKSFSIKEFSASHYTEIELGIINAILICYIYIDKNNPEIKSAYEKLTNFLEEKHIDDFEIAFNIYYEYLMLCCIQNLDLNMRLELALDTAQLALDNGIANKLPFIYYQIALIYTDLGDKENMEEYYSTAIFLYKQIGVPEAYLNKLIANREECRKIVENPEAYR